jgi:hypothetical protein
MNTQHIWTIGASFIQGYCTAASTRASKTRYLGSSPSAPARIMEKKKVCPEVYKQEGKPDRLCVLDYYHSGYCQDETGFKFWIEYLPMGYKVYWPDFLGNGPDGYPMNNKSF